MAERTEELLLALLGRCEDRLPVARGHVRDLAEHREWGIGLEALCTQLHEYAVVLAPEELLAIKQLASEMGLSADAWSFLEPHSEPPFFTSQ
jgi:hypothetical protein